MKAPENNNKKGGFLAALSKLFGGSAASGGAAGSLGSAASGAGSAFSGLGGLFASKAGIVGMVLGGATIAAGVGVVYNFVGPSSKPVYSPSLFENQYYEAEVESASIKRKAVNNADAAGSSSLDYFRDEAKRDGIGFSGVDGEGADGEGADASAEGDDYLASGSADGAAESDGNYDGANAAMANVPKLQKAPSFGASGGGNSRSKLTLGGKGMSGGIGGKFQKIYKKPTGKASSMKGALASKINKSSKYNLPNFNRKGAYGQAKYAGKLGKKASYADSSAGAKTTAIEAFEGETVGEGDVAVPDMGGEGIGGAGVSDGSGLKGSDPSLNDSSYEPPAPDPEEEPEDPSKKYTDMALYGGLAWAVLYMIAKAMAKSQTPWMKAAAIYVAYAAAAAAAVVIFAGVKLMAMGQKWMGMMYLAMGAYMMYMSYQSITGMSKDDGVEEKLAVKTGVESDGGKSVANEVSKQSATGIGKGTPDTVTNSSGQTTTTDYFDMG